MSRFAREAVKKLKPYVPGEQPPPGANVVKLNTNENPYPPCPGVRQLLRTFPGKRLRKYPEPRADTFRQTAARVLNVKPERILAGNGSDEILTLVMRAFVEPGQRIAYPVPTYSLYPVLAAIQEAQAMEVPFRDGFDLPVEELAKVNAAVTFLANPNAPSGTFIEHGKIARLAKKLRGLLFIDEAYVDFAEDNCLDLVRRYSNVIVSRSLSKSHSLAGLRFGYAVAGEPIIADMLKVKDSYNCDALSIALASRAIEDQAYLDVTVARIRRQRTLLTRQLEKLGFAVPPSQANFLWAVRRHPPARQIYLELKRRGILVRYFDKPGLKGGLRITVGLPEENRRLLAALTELLT